MLLQYTQSILLNFQRYLHFLIELNYNFRNNEPEDADKSPMIVRIDKLWSIKSESTENSTEITSTPDVFYLRGALFLRPTDLEHEPTRLFYKNEVFKEMSREITSSLDQVTTSKLSGKKKCSVMSSKKFASDRVTEIDERDVYVCEAKYSLQLKTFRKFTKGLKSQFIFGF